MKQSNSAGSGGIHPPAWEHFADRLAAAVVRAGTPVLVGLDPRYEQLPAPLTHALEDDSPNVRAAAYFRFCAGIIDVVAPLVAAVKPQMAFFEELGPPGMASLAEVVNYAASGGCSSF